MTDGRGTIRLGERPLVMCDVDDVVLEFVTPFQAFLESRGHRLLSRSFRLHGNIIDKKAETMVDDRSVSGLIDSFFAAQEAWQKPFVGVPETLQRLAKEADLVFLTAMPPRHAKARRQLLERFGLNYPLIALEEPKGPVVQRLHNDRPLPVAFVDDMVHNLHSVGEHVPDSLLIHLPPSVAIHKFAPVAAGHVHRVQNWTEAETLIIAHILS